ncbi:MAG: ABC transporter substrate-binding protein [Chloroflexota bacterium]|nr:ABC transporter substrate-binding protein [Chloroflexota bacterium]
MGSCLTHKSVVLVVLLLLALLTGTCGKDEPTKEGGEERIIIVGLSDAPTSEKGGALDPGDHRNRSSETVIRNMFDGLVTRDTLSGVHMELAEHINWLDNQTLEINLRQGVLFHDGVEMTADDVVFTFNRIIQENAIEYPVPHTSPRKSLIAPLESIESIDNYTVLMHFGDPWPPAMQLLVHQQIIPKHYLEEVGTKGFTEHPIGTGPFKFVSADSDMSETVLERFDDYYGGAPDLAPVGPASVDRVIFRVIPDALTRVAALRVGEVDIIQSVPLDLAKVLEQDPNVQVRAAPGTLPKWMEMDVSQPPLDDVRVRQSLNYAVDKQHIIDEIYGGRAVALPGPLSPFNNFVNQKLEPYPYDPARALSILEQAGWTDSEGDGILDMDGEAFKLTIDTVADWRLLAEEIAEQYETIGIDTDVRTWDLDIIRAQMLAGERMAFLEDWGDSTFDPVGHFEAKWHTRISDGLYGRGNFSGYDNERVNKLIRDGEITADMAERQTIYDEAQEIVYREAPAVFLILPEEIEAASVLLRNWEPASDGRINLHDVGVEL